MPFHNVVEWILDGSGTAHIPLHNKAIACIPCFAIIPPPPYVQAPFVLLFHIRPSLDLGYTNHVLMKEHLDAEEDKLHIFYPVLINSTDDVFCPIPSDLKSSHGNYGYAAVSSLALSVQI